MTRFMIVVAAILIEVFSSSAHAQPLGLEERYEGTLWCDGGNERINLQVTYGAGLTSAEGQVNFTREGRRGSRRLMLRSSDGVNFSARGQHAALGQFAFQRLENGRLGFDSPAQYCPGIADLTLRRSSIELDKVPPKDWIGKTPDTVINGETFWDVLQLTQDAASLGDDSSNWTKMAQGCDFQPVKIANYRNSGIMEYPRLIISTKGVCDDGRKSTVYSVMTAPAIMNASMKDRDLKWFGRTCSSKASDPVYQFCKASGDGFTCSVANKSEGYSCHSPAPVIERYVSYQSQLQSDRNCERKWNSCANPVNRPEGSVFSSCYGASGAYETVCYGGAQDARLLGAPVLLPLPKGLESAGLSTKASAPVPGEMVEVLDVMSGETILVPAEQLAESRRKAAEEEQARKAEHERKMAESAERRRIFEAEQAAERELELQAERERAAAAAQNIQSAMTAPPEGFSIFTLTTYSGKLENSSGPQNVMVARYVSATPETGLAGFMFFGIGEEMGHDGCSGVLKLEDKQPVLSSLTYVNEDACNGSIALSMDGTRPSLTLTRSNGEMASTGALSPMPTASAMSFPMPNTWENLLPMLGIE